MKFCIKCGAKLSDDAMFCAACGTMCDAQNYEAEAAAQPESQPVEPKSSKEKHPTKKGKIIGIVCAAVLVLCMAVGGFFGIRWYNSPEQQLLRALKAGQYEEALDIAGEDASLKHSENLSDSLQERIGTVKADYISAAMEYANVMMELETIEKIDIEELRELIAQTRDYVERLNASRTAFSTAETFFSNAAYIEAIAQYKQVIQEDSNYATAVTKVNEAVGLYRTKVLADAESYAVSGNYDNAIMLLHGALTNLPEDSQLNQQILLYEKAQADQILNNALEEAAIYAAAKDYISAMRVLDQYTEKHGGNAEVNVAWNIYSEANKALILTTALDDAALLAADSDYLGAVAILDRYTEENGTNTEVSAARNTYQNAYVDLVIADATVYGEAGAYTNAIALLNNALKEFPGNSRLTAQVTTYEKAYQAQQLADVLAKAKAYADGGDYLSAMNILSTYTADYGSNASVLVALNAYTDKYVDTVLTDAEGQVNSGDYPSAITTLRTGLAKVPENTKLTARLNTYSDAYVAEVIAKSEALLAERDFDGAIDWVVTGLETLPESEVLLAQGDKIWNAMPKSFVDLFDPYQSSNYEECEAGEVFFMSGEARTNGLIWTDSEYGYAYFNLGGKYKLLSFDVGHIDGTYMEWGYIKVYADGKLVADIEVAPDVFPEHVEVDVSGVRQLKIEYSSQYWNEWGQIGMADMIIE